VPRSSTDLCDRSGVDSALTLLEPVLRTRYSVPERVDCDSWCFRQFYSLLQHLPQTHSLPVSLRKKCCKSVFLRTRSG
jgi:hypothetical protein